MRIQGKGDIDIDKKQKIYDDGDIHILFMVTVITPPSIPNVDILP
jgi:hypothetical protein